jgi:antitoxin ParD1/3/4
MTFFDSLYQNPIFLRAARSRPWRPLDISLPEALKEFVHERGAEKAYSNPSDYVRALIRDDQGRRAEQKLEQHLLEGLESGPPQPVTPEDWRAIRRKVQERLSQGRRRGR